MGGILLFCSSSLLFCWSSLKLSAWMNWIYGNAIWKETTYIPIDSVHPCACFLRSASLLSSSLCLLFSSSSIPNNCACFQIWSDKFSLSFVNRIDQIRYENLIGGWFHFFDFLFKLVVICFHHICLFLDLFGKPLSQKNFFPLLICFQFCRVSPNLFLRIFTFFCLLRWIIFICRTDYNNTLKEYWQSV